MDGASFRRQPARRLDAGAAAASCRHRRGQRRRSAATGADPPRQYRTPADDRRPVRRRDRGQYRACRSRTRALAGARAGARGRRKTGRRGQCLAAAALDRDAAGCAGGAGEPAAARRRGRRALASARTRRAPASAAQADQNLAEMAQQLEAALRRGAAAEPRPPVTDALAVPPAAKSAAEARGLPRELKPRAEPHFDLRPDPKIEPKAESKPEPKLDAKAEPVVEPKSEPKPGTGKALLDNLEEEMASLLGRPLGKS